MTVSTVFYVLGVELACVVSWISGLKPESDISQERSLPLAIVPNPKPNSTETEGVVLSGEAAAALHMAVRMNEESKSSKKLKLFQQALKLAPNNPDVLNSYGEFLEPKKLIEADKMFTRALIKNPSHSRALANRQRTRPRVEKLDHNMLDRIDKKRFLSNAISQTATEKENETVKIQNITEIHKHVLGHSHPLEAGQVRDTQVYVSNHIPPHPKDVELFMAEFDKWLSSPETGKLHPITLAALAHHALVYIHPFTDGNGRTARQLMNLILKRAGFCSVTIELSDRPYYYACLEEADYGDVRPFIRFVARCVERTLDANLFVQIKKYLGSYL